MDINTEFVDACTRGDLPAVKEYIKKANIHAGDDAALRWAVYEGHLETIKYLIEQGANVHADDDYALRWAVNTGHLEVVKCLIEQGANIHAKDDLALQWAKGQGHPDVVKYLESVIKKEKDTTSKPHTIVLDGKEVKLSEEGYTKLRQNLLDYM
jgi:ankyrin repeat protein